MAALVTLSQSAEPLTSHAQSADPAYVYYFPLITNATREPLASTSYYLPTTDPTFLYNLGCEHGRRDLLLPGTQDSVIVLDFSYPVLDPVFGFGAALFEDNPYEHPTDPASIDQITDGVKGFAQGYYNCSGADTQSNLVIGVGTNNKPNSIDTPQKAEAHGATWGQMVSMINNWAVNLGIFHQVQTYGASDMEVSWNTPEWTRAWIKGFESAGSNLLIHFGDAAGCPYEDNPHWSCGPYWTVEDVWYIAWGAPSAIPLPLIYLTNGVHAKQWASLSQYSLSQHGYRMDFSGVFTQYYYCQQFKDKPWSTCEGYLDNTPEEAHAQLTKELNKNPGTAQTIRWKTDIRWIHEDEVNRKTTTVTDSGFTSHPVYDEIAKLQFALETPTLSPLLKSSLETKLKIYETLALMIETSKQHPATKNLP